MGFAILLSLIMAGFAVVGVFIPIPFVSEWAFWIMTAAYVVAVSRWRV